MYFFWSEKLEVVKNYAHTGAYSIVALQEMNLAYKYPTIYWSCACLVNDSGSLEDNSEEEIVDIYEPEADDFANGVTFIDLPNKKQKIRKTSSTDYAKLARAINKIKDAGIEIKPVSINNSGFSFRPDEENNTIFFGMKGLLNVSDDLVKQIIDNRPYNSIKDFYYRISPKRQSMVSLIKSGAFDEFIDDRKFNMAWYLWEVCDKKKRITLQNMSGLIKYKLIPTETEEFQQAKRIYEFNRYLKTVCKVNSQIYQLDDRAINFLSEFDYTDLIEGTTLNAKTWDKKYQTWMDIFRSWIVENKDEILQKLNSAIFKEDWIKYASGSVSAWEMEVMCFYYHEHELKDVNSEKYGFNDFFKLPSEPEVERSFRKGDKIINLYKLGKLCGTCIAKDNNKSTITLLTTTGVVTVKFNKQYYSMFNKVLFEKNSDGTKTTIEKSWFNRGSKLVIQGMRSGEAFIAKKYASSGTHTMYKITEVLPNGDIIVQDERVSVGDE